MPKPRWSGLAAACCLALAGGAAQAAPAAMAEDASWRAQQHVAVKEPVQRAARVPAPASAAAPSKAAPEVLARPVQAMRDWVLATRDHEGGPFAVIDKQQARLWLFDALGKPLGNTAVLLGAARGDASVPGIGEKPLHSIRPEERTTPAGRFLAEPGHNAKGEDIFWVDYDAAVSLHRVRATNPAERRLQRLATATPADNRISYGCINVPAAFYDGQLRPLFSSARGVVYLLPEILPASSLFTPVERTVPRAGSGQRAASIAGQRGADRPDLRPNERKAPSL